MITVDELLTQMTQIFFVVLVIVTFADFLRHRDKIRRDIFLVFLSLAAGILVQMFSSITGIEALWLSRVGTVSLVIQPYLLLRLVQYFRPVPLLLRRLALLGTVVSLVIVIVMDSPLPIWGTLVVMSYFLIVYGFAIFSFVQGAFATVGVVRQRLRFAAAGSGFLIAVLLVAALRTIVPDMAPFSVPVTQLLAMCSALTYYLSFAPPRWLRQAWQLSELRDYLSQLQQPGDRTTAIILERLEQAVKRAMGTELLAVALRDKDNNEPAIEKVAVDLDPQTLFLGGLIREAWQERAARARSKSSIGTAGDLAMLNSLDVESVLIIPIAANNNSVLGLLIVFLQHGSLFVDDDINLLTIFSQQTAILLENYAMVEELQRHAEALEQRVVERTAALQRSNDELRQFAYIASHDLQEPLRTISSYLQLIESRYLEKLDSDGREFIAFAVDAAVRMKDLISALLAYSRVESQMRPFVPVDCQNVIEDLQKFLAVTIDEAGAVITYDPLPPIKGDRDLLLQLFQNLIANAIKYRGDKKPEIHIGAKREKALWVFSVQDNGIGIEPQYLDRIFVIFQRLHHRNQYSGTGIGLAVCKKVVELHGGRIWAESQAGQGTRIMFSLPAIEI